MGFAASSRTLLCPSGLEEHDSFPSLEQRESFPLFVKKRWYRDMCMPRGTGG